MTAATGAPSSDQSLSLYHLLEPDVLANPYPLYHRLQREDPVHWDAFLHSWVVTRYADALLVLNGFSANCAPKPETIAVEGVSQLNPIAEVLRNQFLFMDPPRHTQLRALVSHVFSPHRVEDLRARIQEIVNNLLDSLGPADCMEVMADLANPLPTIVSAELLGLPASDQIQLKAWSANFAEILGNFQHNTDRLSDMLRSLHEVECYLRAAIQEARKPGPLGLLSVLASAELDGRRLSDDEIIATSLLLMVGAQETTPNLIGCGIFSLLRNPDQLDLLRSDVSLMSVAIEEFLRYESPSQHTTRLAPENTELSGKQIAKGQAVIVVMGAANRDPERFREPDRLDITRNDNRHLAFGGGSHFCFGAPLARIEGQLAINAVLRRFRNLRFQGEPPSWRYNVGLRGLESLRIRVERA